MADLTSRTLASVRRLPRHRGHLLNWYDTRSLLPLPPSVVSSRDNGNLVASLWTLQSGCFELLHRPLLQPALAAGFLDNVHALVDLGALERKRFSEFKRDSNRQNWLQFLVTVPDAILEEVHQSTANSKNAAEARWFGEQARERINHVRNTTRRYSPWLLPEFAPLESDRAVLLQRLPSASPLGALPDFIDSLSVRLQAALNAAPLVEAGELYRSLLASLPEARANVVSLIKDLREIADEAGRIAREMDFGILLDQKRGLLSVGLDVATEKLLTGCYDLLATESRIAVFAGIAKDDIPQETWFLLGRGHTIDHGRAVLRSWSGTMFEYLMPALWMRVYPNTLLERSMIAAVRSQLAYAASFGIPWGISESAYFRTDGNGNYQYYAFGLPHLAAGRVDLDGPVISPYSTFLALPVDPAAALENLRTMLGKRWSGIYGFYEAIDFHASRRRARSRGPEIVRAWMAHHQGMSLLSIANFLQDDVVQRWFHKHPQVQATELLLQEKPATHVRPTRRSFRIKAA